MAPSPPRFPGIPATTDAVLDALENQTETSRQLIDPSFDRLVAQLDQAQATLLTVRRHTTAKASAEWLDAALCDVLSEAEYLRDQALDERCIRDC